MKKIEGFYDICCAHGLNGQQGVLIPASNAKNLMLRRNVIEAAASGNFHVYPMNTIEEGIELLSGVPMGVPDQEGKFPEGTIGARVQARLRLMAQKQLEFGGRPNNGGQGE